MQTRQLIAILRGIHPDSVVEVGKVLIQAGITQIEVPLNSPQAIISIALLSEHLGTHAAIGAGTVLSAEEVDEVYAVGGQFIVSPNCDAKVIQHTKALSMQSCPGVMTPSECFTALQAGADLLKLFPASLLGIEGFKALAAVLPANCPCYAVGGIDSHNIPQWRKAGVTGFGLGSCLYKAGDSPDTVANKAKHLVNAWDAAN